MEDLAKFIAGVVALAVLLGMIPVIGPWLGAIVLFAGLVLLIIAMFKG
jgi:hypothetical protein